VAVSIIDQEIVSLLFEILAAVQRQEQIQLLQDVKTLVNGMVGLVGQTFAQSLSNGYKLDQLAGKANAIQSQLQSVSATQQQMFTAVEALPADTTSAVWDQLVYPTYPIRMQDVMRFLEQLEDVWFNSGALDLWEAPYFLLSIGVTPGTAPPAMPIRTPIWDISQVEAGDTLLSFVARLNTYVTWSYHTGPGDHVSGQYNDGAGSIWTFTTKLDEAAFQLLKSAYLHIDIAAPVWPGLGNVTLGTPVALTNGVTVSGPLNGVLLAITSGYQNLPGFPFGTAESYKHLGAVTFVSDNGQYEYAQSFGFTDTLVLPKTMAVAQSAVVRTIPGLTGTVTPFTINP